MDLKKTPLYEKHVLLNAKIIDFGGWAMPVQYSNVIEEHHATRAAAALFDICHMGELEVKGPRAFDLLQFALTRDLADQRPGQVKLSALLNEKGGIIDDLTVYKKSDNSFMLVTNATTREADFSQISGILRQKRYDCVLEDISEKTGKLDIQGPRAQEILRQSITADLQNLPYYHFMEVKIMDIPSIISRSGYTGEDGFEVYAPAKQISIIWDRLMEAGKPFGLKPAGMGARDTLRLEAGMMLNGQDMTRETTPLEVPYGWLIDWKKDFIGKPALEELEKTGSEKKLVGFEMIGRGISRHGYKVFDGKKEIGVVTSGTFSPTLNKAIGLAFLDADFSAPETLIDIAIRATMAQAKIVKLPFYKRKK